MISFILPLDASVNVAAGAWYNNVDIIKQISSLREAVKVEKIIEVSLVWLVLEEMAIICQIYISHFTIIYTGLEGAFF